MTSVLPDGRLHVVPVGFTWDGTIARVITNGPSRKARNMPGPVTLCQIDGRRWLTIEGRGSVSSDPARVADAVERYSARYRQPRVNPIRVVIEIEVVSFLGSPEFFVAG